MSLFTKKERGDLCYMHDNDPEKLFDATVAAVLEKLTAGVSVEPALKVYNGDVCYKSNEDDQSYGMWIPVDTNYVPPFDGLLYTATAIAAARVQENERCVQACAAKSKEYLARSNRDQHSHGAGLGAAICAELLSALLGKEQS